jgi:hypothetical protein
MALGAVLLPTGNAAGTMSGSYVDGDVMGTLTTLAGAFSANNGSGVVEKIGVYDDTDTLLAFDLYVASASVTQAADSAAFAPSDSDNRLYVARFQFQTPQDVGGARQVFWYGSENIWNTATNTSMYVTMVARSTMAGAITTSGIKLIFAIRQDQ